MNHLKKDSQAFDVEQMLVLLKAGHGANIAHVALESRPKTDSL